MFNKSLKKFIIDTNVLLEDPSAISKFEENDVILPIIVLEELDKFKKGTDEKARNARTISRTLDRVKDAKDLAKGIKINKSNGKLHVQILTKEINEIFNEITVNTLESVNDNLIISTALFFQRNFKDEIIIVTRDSNMRIRARALGLIAQDYESEKVNFDEIYSGVVSATMSDYEGIEELHKNGFTSKPLDKTEDGEKIKLFPNQFVIINENTNSSMIAQVDKNRKKLKLLSGKGDYKREASGIIARNTRQKFAFDLLLNDDIKLVSLIGRAGSGKTLLAIAAGLKMVLEDKKYKSLMVARPIVPMGGYKNDIGYLPGSKDEKISEWMQPIYDNLDFIFDCYDVESLLGSKDKKINAKDMKSYDYLKETGVLKVEALSFIRGRSIPNQYIIIDEAQNLSKEEVKTIISRAGEGSKIVLTGE